MQPVTVWPKNINGKLHSEFGSGPDVVEQVEMVGGGVERPGKKQANQENLIEENVSQLNPSNESGSGRK